MSIDVTFADFLRLDSCPTRRTADTLTEVTMIYAPPQTLPLALPERHRGRTIDILPEGYYRITGQTVHSVVLERDGVDWYVRSLEGCVAC